MYDPLKLNIAIIVELICLPPQHWSGAILPQGVWLQPRAGHTAHSLWDPDSDPEDPCVVVTCGEAADDAPLGDMWILSVNRLASAQVSE